MAFLAAADFNSILYPEIITAVSRGDTTLLTSAINAGIEEARGYLLPRYDADAALNAEADDRNPILLVYVKDLVVWHFIALANPNIEITLREDRYKTALNWFKAVQAGTTNPNLPVPAPDVNGNDPETGIQFSSNLMRNNNPADF
jgi:hypothetical protein